MLDEHDLISADFVVFLSEFISSDAISHLFSQEQVTTIVNSIRTDVTQAGLTYTRDVAWQFFLKYALLVAQSCKYKSTKTRH